MAKGSLFDNRKTKRSPQDADYGGDISVSRDEVKYLYDQLKQFSDNPYPKLRIYGEVGVKKDGGEYIKLNCSIPKKPFSQPQQQPQQQQQQSTGGNHPWDEE